MCKIFQSKVGHIENTEGIGKDNELSKMQQAFVDYHSVQCGYCIPGMVLAGEQLLKDNSNATEKEIKQGISGNICRCTGYTKIIDAISALTPETQRHKEKLKELN